jgi:hypothetical protein
MYMYTYILCIYIYLSIYIYNIYIEQERAIKHNKDTFAGTSHQPFMTGVSMGRRCFRPPVLAFPEMLPR